MALNTAKLLEHFLSGKAALTVNAYEKDMEDFRIHLKVPTVQVAIQRLLGSTHPNGQALIASYKAEMTIKRGLGSSTVNRRLSALRSLGKEARILGMVPWVLEAKNVRHEFVRDTRGPTDAHVDKLFAYLTTKPMKVAARRDYAIMRLMSDLGLRRGAVCKINMADFFPDRQELKVQEKGKRSKTAEHVPKDTCAVISTWLAARGPTVGAMFINFDTIHRTKTGKRLTGSAIWDMLKKRCAEAGVPRIRPHGLRRWAINKAAEIAARRRYSLSDVTKFSKHAGVQTLEKNYLEKGRAMQGELSDGVAAELRKLRR